VHTSIPPRVAASPEPLGDAIGPRVVLGEVEVLPARRARAAVLTGRCGLALEACEALDDVAEEARLPLLAIGDDVDAGVGLAANDVGDGLAHQARVGLGVVRLAAVLRGQQRNEVVGAREAADVRREDPVGAALHRVVLLPYPRCRRPREKRLDNDDERGNNDGRLVMLAFVFNSINVARLVW
jgi:hypothetical protein